MTSKISSSRPPPMNMPVIGMVGKYELLGRLAYGGMAEIFLAREHSAAGASRQLVIKRILPHVAHDQQFVKMFLDEARIVMRLAHPNICHIYDFGQIEDTYYIAMEWVSGVSLGKLIRRARTLGGIPTAFAVRIIAEIAEALHYAHRAKDELGRPLGIVHRDVSPENVMISFDGTVTLREFGIAKQTAKEGSTQAGVIKGKFAYMSPEQCRAADLDARSDVFALGICLYEALTGKPLYHRKADLDTMMAIVKETVPSARAVNQTLPESLDAIVKKALQKLPERRFQTAGQMQEALENHLAATRQSATTSKIAEYLGTQFPDDGENLMVADSTPFGSSYVENPELVEQRFQQEQAERDEWTSSGSEGLGVDAFAETSPQAEATDTDADADADSDADTDTATATDTDTATDTATATDTDTDADADADEEDDVAARKSRRSLDATARSRTSRPDPRDQEIRNLRARERALVAALVDEPNPRKGRWVWILLGILFALAGAAVAFYYLAPVQSRALLRAIGLGSM